MGSTYIIDTIELQKIMIEQGIKTITELSEKSGVGRDTLSGLINGKIRPSFGVLIKLASTLDLSPETAGRIFFCRQLT